MNNLPLILLGGLGAAFLLNKKKSTSDISPSEKPFKVIKTNFPGYEFKNNKLIVTDEIKALTYINKVAIARVKDFDRIAHNCITGKDLTLCNMISSGDWIYNLGLDLFGFSRINRVWGDAKYPLTKSNIIKFNNKFKEYIISDPDVFNYLVLNYIKFQLSANYTPIATALNKWDWIFTKFTQENLIEWYKKYLLGIGLEKYIPTDKEVEFVFST